MVVLSVFLFVKSSWGQYKIVSYITSEISNDLGVEVSFKDMEVNFFNNFVIRGLYIEDLRGDTLLYLDEFNGDISQIDRKRKTVSFSKVRATHPVIKIRKYEGDTTINYQFILDRYFKDTGVKDDRSKWKFSVSEIKVDEGIFKLDDYNRLINNDKFNVFHVELSQVNGIIDNINQKNGSLALNIEQFSFIEKCGFILDSLSSAINISNSKLEFVDLRLKTPHSVVNVDGHLGYPDGAFLNNFKNDVNILAHLQKGSKLNTQDLKYFSNGLGTSSETLYISGKVVGTIDRLKGKDLDLTFGNHSSFKGNMSFDGLPDIDKTFINFKVNQFITDYDEIVGLQLPFLKEFITTNTKEFQKIKQY